MQQAARQEAQTGWRDLLWRLAGGAGLIGIACVLALAVMLEPDPSGHGTHRRLGLPPCTLYALTGVPCPTCGVTTAFSHMVRLQVFQALRVQPFGVLCFVIVLLCAAFCAATVLCGRVPTNWLQSTRVDPVRWLLGILAFAGLSWIYKIILVVILK